jgi:hypothetical protein
VPRVGEAEPPNLPLRSSERATPPAAMNQPTCQPQAPCVTLCKNPINLASFAKFWVGVLMPVKKPPTYKKPKNRKNLKTKFQLR